MDIDFLDVLRRIWMQPTTTKSDYARANADVIAALASDGLLTTRISPGVYGRDWLITASGLMFLGLFDPDENNLYTKDIQKDGNTRK